MPAISKQQQKFMGVVLALKRREIKPSEVSAEVREAARTMTMAEVEGFAETKHGGLPVRVKKAGLGKYSPKALLEQTKGLKGSVKDIIAHRKILKRIRDIDKQYGEWGEFKTNIPDVLSLGNPRTRKVQAWLSQQMIKNKAQDVGRGLILPGAGLGIGMGGAHAIKKAELSKARQSFEKISAVGLGSLFKATRDIPKNIRKAHKGAQRAIPDIKRVQADRNDISALLGLRKREQIARKRVAQVGKGLIIPGAAGVGAYGVKKMAD